MMNVFPFKLNEFTGNGIFTQYVIANINAIKEKYGAQWHWSTTVATVIDATTVKFLTDSEEPGDVFVVKFKKDILKQHIEDLKLKLATAEFDRRERIRKEKLREDGIQNVLNEMFNPEPRETFR